jgi:nucleoside-diphosphate-sugar epimerase
VRASDFFGLGAGENAHLGRRFFRPLLAGRTAWGVGDVTQPHSWAYLPDVVDALVAAADRDEWGRAWLAPHSAASSRTEIADHVRRTTGARGQVRSWPAPVWAAVSAVVPFVREIRELEYQFREPFVVDATASERALGLTATPWDDALEATVASYR